MHTPSKVERYVVAPEDEPAIVHDLTAEGFGKRATVTHPAGPTHPNAVATRRRLMARGFAIVPITSKAGATC